MRAGDAGLSPFTPPGPGRRGNRCRFPASPFLLPPSACCPPPPPPCPPADRGPRTLDFGLLSRPIPIAIGSSPLARGSRLSVLPPIPQSAFPIPHSAACCLLPPASYSPFLALRLLPPPPSPLAFQLASRCRLAPEKTAGSLISGKLSCQRAPVLPTEAPVPRCLYVLYVLTTDLRDSILSHVRITAFFWDDTNLTHIAAHGVSPEEAEQTLSHAARARRSGFDRYVGIGPTEGGRFLVVVFRRLGGGLVRVITARDATPKEKQAYGRR
jgi:uncharacterized DUF497 family protein